MHIIHFNLFNSQGAIAPFCPPILQAYVPIFFVFPFYISYLTEGKTYLFSTLQK